jgi:7-carboxy-7-deazaguanine synthase
MNTQPPEKQVLTNVDDTLVVHSIFYTIQGEGIFAGHPAVFIRLAGCNLQCPGCDTDYLARTRMRPAEIEGRVREIAPDAHRPLVVITGGEPFRQPIGTLCAFLLFCGYTVQIETNGTLYQHLPYGHEGLTIICSPKTGEVNSKLLPHIDAFKYVLRSNSICPDDGLPLRVLGHPGKKVFRAPKEHPAIIYIQPEDEGNEGINKSNLEAVKASCLKHGHVLGLQLHKIIGVA